MHIVVAADVLHALALEFENTLRMKHQGLQGRVNTLFIWLHVDYGAQIGFTKKVVMLRFAAPTQMIPLLMARSAFMAGV